MFLVWFHRLGAGRGDFLSDGETDRLLDGLFSGSRGAFSTVDGSLSPVGSFLFRRGLLSRVFSSGFDIGCLLRIRRHLQALNGSLSPDKNIKVIMRLLFQATIYFDWAERNARLHSSASRPAVSRREEIQRVIRRKLDPLSRAPRNIP
ncbi:unnamed protein product [Microthlaspi erraticum]|uniref:Uncharacterized protein n=1 Tax=Microthlaspi erraticum TaxID=1685480 RepID=A0A6D2ILR7_9BRAS|nr:unnamed protein product [Microthlaspi erraticum]